MPAGTATRRYAPGLVAIWARQPPNVAGASPPAADASAPASAAAVVIVPEVTPRFFNVNKFRAKPDSPGAIRIPGTNVALYIGGFRLARRDW